MTERDRRAHHPIFARLFARMSLAALAKGQADHRRELLTGLAGRVIEVGAGNGLNFAFYPISVTEVVAVEPEPYLRSLALDAARAAPVPVVVTDGLAEELPARDSYFDAGVASLVLCSVRCPADALSELLRVIRPGGELRFYEHVRADSARLATLQRMVDGLFWPRIAGGCHTSRDTRANLQNAGFKVEIHRGFPFRPCFLLAPVSPHILGVARRPAGSPAIDTDLRRTL
ncbi:MAG: class I SAM-dependent methyltransferase [Acidobacteria bacterium]|nr:class I SAM-dependent methyltransferase [Acidobacteriota bacterium]